MKQKLDGGMISFRADADLRDRLQRIADRDERSLANTVRRLVLRALGREERKAATR